MAGKKVIAVKDWTCAISDELGRVVLTINRLRVTGFRYDDDAPTSSDPLDAP